MKLTAEATVLNDGKLNTNINNAQDTADTAVTKADNAQSTADSAQATANQAKTIADNTNQYFWFTSSGTDTGAHISEKTQAQFIASPSGGNLLARSNGIAVRDGLTELATFSASGININQSGATVASFGASGAELGKNSNTAIIKMCNDALRLYGQFGTGNNSFKSVVENTKPITGLLEKELLLKNSSNVSIALRENSSDEYEVSITSDDAELWVASDPINGASVNVSPLLAVSAIADSSDTNIRDMSLRKLSTGHYGLYSDTLDKWIIALNSSDHVVIPTIPDNTTTTGTANVHCNDYGVLYLRTSSSKRFKRDIEDIEKADALYDVQVRQFKYKNNYINKDDQRFDTVVPGFIVEELKDVYPIAVDYEGDNPKDWNERYLIPPMLKLIQEQHEQIEELTKRIEALERANK